MRSRSSTLLTIAFLPEKLCLIADYGETSRRDNGLMPASASKSTLFDYGCDIARAVQHADNHNFVRERLVVDRVGVVERNAQSGRKQFPRDACKRKMTHRLKCSLYRFDESIRRGLSRFRGQINPDFRKIGLGGMG